MTYTVRDLMEESGVAFGTSGARGLVTSMTDRVCYGYTRGFLSYLAEVGEFSAGVEVALAGDLRPASSPPAPRRSATRAAFRCSADMFRRPRSRPTPSRAASRR
jgi:phosphomannomutase